MDAHETWCGVDAHETRLTAAVWDTGRTESWAGSFSHSVIQIAGIGDFPRPAFLTVRVDVKDRAREPAGHGLKPPAATCCRRASSAAPRPSPRSSAAPPRCGLTEEPRTAEPRVGGQSYRYMYGERTREETPGFCSARGRAAKAHWQSSEKSKQASTEKPAGGFELEK